MMESALPALMAGSFRWRWKRLPKWAAFGLLDEIGSSRPPSRGQTVGSSSDFFHRTKCRGPRVRGEFHFAGAVAESVLIMDEGDGLGRLRLPYVELWAHGSGIGSALMREYVEFAQAVGYRRMTLWTHSILEAARRVDAREGFKLISTDDRDSFGPTLTGEIWELSLEKTL
jgi:GNAT superfamily N-acetyltransferase